MASIVKEKVYQMLGKGILFWSGLGSGLAVLCIIGYLTIDAILELCSIGIAKAIYLAPLSLKDGFGGMNWIVLSELSLSNQYLEYLGMTYTLYVTNGSNIVLVTAIRLCDGSYRYICGGKLSEKIPLWERQQRGVTTLCMANLRNRLDRPYLVIRYMRVSSQRDAEQ